MNNHPTETSKAAVRWMQAADQINACKHCIHGEDDGMTCAQGFRLEHTAKARSSGGKCGPEATLMWGKSWGPKP